MALEVEEYLLYIFLYHQMCRPTVSEQVRQAHSHTACERRKWHDNRGMRKALQ